MDNPGGEWQLEWKEGHTSRVPPSGSPGKPRVCVLGEHAQLLTGVEEEAKGGSSSVLWRQMEGREWLHQGAGRVKTAQVRAARSPLQHG